MFSLQSSYWHRPHQFFQIYPILQVFKREGYYTPNRLIGIGGESVSKESIRLFQVDFRGTAYLHELPEIQATWQ